MERYHESVGKEGAGEGRVGHDCYPVLFGEVTDCVRTGKHGRYEDPFDTSGHSKLACLSTVSKVPTHGK